MFKGLNENTSVWCVRGSESAPEYRDAPCEVCDHLTRSANGMSGGKEGRGYKWFSQQRHMAQATREVVGLRE